MPVRSLRLPEELWRRLEAATAEVNRHRRRRVSVPAETGDTHQCHGPGKNSSAPIGISRRGRDISISSVIRALLERALNEPGDALNFDAKIPRPPRVIRNQKAKLAAAQAEREAADLFRKVSDAVDRLQIQPAEFASAVGGNRSDVEQFYHRGTLPEGDATPLIARIRNWLNAQSPC